MSFDPAAYQSFLRFGEFSDLYLEERQTLTIRWCGGRVDSAVSENKTGMGLRYINGFESRYLENGATNPFQGVPTKEEILNLERHLPTVTAGFPALHPQPVSGLFLGTHYVIQPPQEVSLADKALWLASVYQSALIGSSIRQVSLDYVETIKMVGYVNSLGESFWEDRTYLVLSLRVTAEEDGRLETGFESLGGLIGFELFKEKKAEMAAIRAAHRALRKLQAPPAPTGSMPVIIASRAGGTLIHEAIGHSLEADHVQEGTSPIFQGKLGQKVAHEKLTILDNPTLSGSRGSFAFDDEGVPSRPTVLVENGILKDYLYDRLTAKRAGRASNGHGRRESFAHLPIPRMSNTLIASGTDDPQEIEQSLQNGFFVAKMGGGQVNTTTGDFVFDVEEGYRVRQGEKILVRGATLLGNAQEVLMNIEAVGWDLGWGIGTCGKQGQGVPVSDAIPTLRVKELLIGGQADK